MGMKLKTALVVAGALTFTTSVNAASWATDEVRGRTCGVSAYKTVSIPRQAKVEKIRVFANGGELDGEAVSRLRAQWIGRNAAVTIAFTRQAGPATVRVANLRPSGCTRFRVVIRWYV